MRAKPIRAFLVCLRHKKRNGPIQASIPYCVWLSHKSTFCLRHLCRKTKKCQKTAMPHRKNPLFFLMPGQLLTQNTIINSVCIPVSASQGSTGTCGLRKAGRHIGYVLPLPVPHNRSRIKINYGFILAQYLVSCQLDNTISITFYLFQNIFKYFPARRVFLYITFSEHPDEVFRSLKTEEHTPSCIWVLMAGFLHRVCPAQMKSHTVQPVNAAGEGAGNGDGRYA